MCIPLDYNSSSVIEYTIYSHPYYHSNVSFRPIVVRRGSKCAPAYVCRSYMCIYIYIERERDRERDHTTTTTTASTTTTTITTTTTTITTTTTTTTTTNNDNTYYI